MAQFGRALRSGRRGRVFESRRFDTYKNAGNLRVSGIFLFWIKSLDFMNFERYTKRYTKNQKLNKSAEAKEISAKSFSLAFKR